MVWISTTACIFIFFVLGIPGAMAFKDVLQGPATNTCEMAQRPGQGSFNCANDIMAILTDPTLAPASLYVGCRRPDLGHPPPADDDVR